MVKAKPKTPLRVEILNTGAVLTNGDRDKDYGSPVVNYIHTAALLTAYFKDKLGYESYEFTAEDACMIQVLVKASRIAGGHFKLDNYIDGATYLAMAGECRSEG